MMTRGFKVLGVVFAMLGLAAGWGIPPVGAQVKVAPTTVARPEAAGAKVAPESGVAKDGEGTARSARAAAVATLSAQLQSGSAVMPHVPPPPEPGSAPTGLPVPAEGPVLAIPAGQVPGDFLVNTGLPLMRQVILDAQASGDMTTLGRLFAQPNLLVELQTLLDRGMLDGLQGDGRFFVDSFSNNGTAINIGLQTRPGLFFVLDQVPGGLAITRILLP